MIRAWIPDGQEPDGQAARLHGIVERPRGGEARAFDGADELLALVEAAVARLQAPSGAHRGDDRP